MSEVVLALEYCQGGDMLDRINTRGKYSEKQAKIYFKQIVEALAFCYASGFSHRDVKVCKKKKKQLLLFLLYTAASLLLRSSAR
jgi:serine/threonine protein kinase